MALLTLIFSRAFWSHAITPNIYGDAIGRTYSSFPSYASEVIKTIITSREKNTLDYVVIDHIPSLHPLYVHVYIMSPLTYREEPSLYTMRHWCAIVRLIKTKVETGNFDAWEVKDWLWHYKIDALESYIRYAKKYYNQAPYEWIKNPAEIL
jgi:hypothetical protein